MINPLVFSISAYSVLKSSAHFCHLWLGSNLVGQNYCVVRTNIEYNIFVQPGYLRNLPSSLEKHADCRFIEGSSTKLVKNHEVIYCNWIIIIIRSETWPIQG